MTPAEYADMERSSVWVGRTLAAGAGVGHLARRRVGGRRRKDGRLVDGALRQGRDGDRLPLRRVVRRTHQAGRPQRPAGISLAGPGTPERPPGDGHSRDCRCPRAPADRVADEVAGLLPACPKPLPTEGRVGEVRAGREPAGSPGPVERARSSGTIRRRQGAACARERCPRSMPTAYSRVPLLADSFDGPAPDARTWHRPDWPVKTTRVSPSASATDICGFPVSPGLEGGTTSIPASCPPPSRDGRRRIGPHPGRHDVRQAWSNPTSGPRSARAGLAGFLHQDQYDRSYAVGGFGRVMKGRAR